MIDSTVDCLPMIPHFLITLSALLTTAKLLGHSPIDWFVTLAPLIIAIIIQTMVNMVQRHMNRLAEKRANEAVEKMKKASRDLFRSMGARILNPDDDCDS